MSYQGVSFYLVQFSNVLCCVRVVCFYNKVSYMLKLHGIIWWVLLAFGIWVHLPCMANRHWQSASLTLVSFCLSSRMVVSYIMLFRVHCVYRVQVPIQWVFQFELYAFITRWVTGSSMSWRHLMSSSTGYGEMTPTVDWWVFVCRVGWWRVIIRFLDLIVFTEFGLGEF